MPDIGAPPSGAGEKSTRGLMAELSSLAGSFGSHIQALLALAGFESKEAAGIYVKAVAALVGALVFAIFGYVFVILFIAFLLALVLGVSWIWVTLSLALFHFAAAALAVAFVIKSVKRPVFVSTAAELKRDFEALKNIKP